MPAPRIDIAVLEQIIIGLGLIVGRTISVLEQFSDVFRRAFSECAVASFAVRIATWIESSEIAFVNSTTKVLSACVAIARFASASVWSLCILVKSATLACAGCTFAAYPLVFEVMHYISVSFIALVKRALKLLQVSSSLGFRDHSQQSS